MTYDTPRCPSTVSVLSTPRRTAFTGYIALNFLWRKCLWYRPNYGHQLRVLSISCVESLIDHNHHIVRASVCSHLPKRHFNYMVAWRGPSVQFSSAKPWHDWGWLWEDCPAWHGLVQNKQSKPDMNYASESFASAHKSRDVMWWGRTAERTISQLTLIVLHKDPTRFSLCDF